MELLDLMFEFSAIWQQDMSKEISSSVGEPVFVNRSHRELAEKKLCLA